MNRVDSVKTGFGRKIASLAEKESSIALEDVSKIKDQIIAVYKEWIQIHGHPATSLRSQLNYVSLVSSVNFFLENRLTFVASRERLAAVQKLDASFSPGRTGSHCGCV